MPESFSKIPLGEIADLFMGQSPESRFVHDGLDQGLPFLQGNGEFGEQYPEPKYSCAQPARTCKKDDVLISVRAPVGEINLADTDYCIGRGLAAIRFHDIPPILGRKLISKFGPELRKVAQGTTFEAIGRKELASLNLLVPPISERNLIAQILDTLDTQIRRTEALIAKLAHIKQGLLTDLLTRGIDQNGQLRPTPDQAPHLYKDSPLGRIPKEWTAVPIDQLADNLDGRRVPIKKAVRRSGIYPYYGASGIIDWVDGYIFDGDYVLLGEDGENVVSRRLPLAFRVTGKIWVNNHAHVYSPLPDTDIRFLVHVLERKDYSPWVNGSAQPKLTQAAISFIRFVKPQHAEQKAISDSVESLNFRIVSERILLDKLRLDKNGLMDDLLTGRVRVTALLDPKKRATA